MDENRPQDESSQASPANGEQLSDTGSTQVEPGYLSLSDAASQTPYSQEYISLLVRKGRLAGKKFGRNWHIRQEALNAYIAEQVQKASTKATILESSPKAQAEIGTNLANLSQNIENLTKKVDTITQTLAPVKSWGSFVPAKKPFLALPMRQILLVIALTGVLSAPIFSTLFSLQDQVAGLRTQFSQVLAQTPVNVHSTVSEGKVKDLIASALAPFRNQATTVPQQALATSEPLPQPQVSPVPGMVLGIDTDNQLIISIRQVLADPEIQNQFRGPAGPPTQYIPNSGSVFGTTSPTAPPGSTVGTIGSATFLSSKDFQTETITVSEDADILGNLTLQGSLSLTGNASITGDTLLVEADTTFEGDLTVNGTTTLNGLSITNNTLTSNAQATFTKVPTLPHSFSPSFPTGTSNAADGTVYINPASAVADSNLLSAAVNGSIKFLVDAEGDIYGNNLILAGSVSQGETTIAGNLNVQDNVTFGDASTDTVTYVGRVNSNILPATNNTYDLGSTANKFKDLYLAGALNAGSFNKVTITPPATGSTLTIADGKVFTISNTLTFTGTDSSSVAFGTGGTVVYTTRTINGKALSSDITLGLASADFANQGTTTTVLHGNAAGNPSFGAVVSADLNITTTSCTNQVVRAISSSVLGTCITVTSAYVDSSIGLTGSTLAQFAATTSAQLAGVISDETGSGALVFADTPTLVTPVLGAATATSINGLTISSSNGTLTITNGKVLSVSNTLTFTGTDSSSVAFGSGGTVAYQGGTLAQFASTTSAELASVISDETGSSSGVLVFNNAPTITNPVITNINPGANFTLTQNSVTPFVSENTGAVANTLYLKAGNVGVGTTDPTLGKLQVNGVVAINGAAATAYLDIRNGTARAGIVSSSDALTGSVNDLALYAPSAGGGSGGNIQFWSGGNFAAEILANGNVGIGTTDPGTNKLEVDGTNSSLFKLVATGSQADARMTLDASGSSGTGRATIAINSKSAVGSRIEFNQAGTNMWTMGAGAAGDGSNFELYNQGTGGTNSTNFYIAHSTGNVGIGTTNPAYKLTLPNATYLSFNNDGGNPFGMGGGDNARLRIFAGNGGAEYSIQFGAFDNVSTFTEYMRVDTGGTGAGNVGIGTTSPGGKIHVNLGNNELAIFNDASNASGIWGMNVGLLSQSTKAQITTRGAIPLVFMTGGTLNSMTAGTEWMSIAPSGLITMTPTGSEVLINSADAALEISPGASGTGAHGGAIIYLQRNTSGNGAPGELRMSEADGSVHWHVFFDNAGDLRASGTQPTEANGVAHGTVIGTQTSWYAVKENINPWDGGNALETIVNTPLYSYQFIEDGYQKADGSKPSYNGLVIYADDRANNAWYARNLGPNQTPVLNEPNLFGYLIAATQALTKNFDLIYDRTTEKIVYKDDADLDGHALFNVKSITSLSGKWSISEQGLLVTKEVHTDKLCIGQTCVTEEQLQTLLQNSGMQNQGGAPSGEGGGNQNPPPDDGGVVSGDEETPPGDEGDSELNSELPEGGDEGVGEEAPPGDEGSGEQSPDDGGEPTP